jgi:hypothetical protein
VSGVRYDFRIKTMFGSFPPVVCRRAHITTNVVSSNPAHGEVYSIQHYVIKFVNDLRKIGGGFFSGTSVSSTNNTVFVLLYFFFWPLCCLFFFDIRILISPLVSSNFSI